MEKIAIILLAIICIFAVVVILACCKVSGECSRQEEEHPCETCVRWSECNGVDDDCPRRNEDGK